jgi:hypothetical protein
MEDKVEADTDVISECGVGNPLMQVTRSAISSGLFEEGNTVDDDRFGRFKHGTGCQRTTTGIGILNYDHLQIFLAQICTGQEQQINPGEVVCGTVRNLSFFWIFELEAIPGVGEG